MPRSTALPGSPSSPPAQPGNPRSSNTGVRIGSNPPPNPAPTRGLRARFDWYEATISEADDGRVETALALALGGSLHPAKGRNGYGRAVEVERGDVTLATVLGGSARPGEVHVSITGEACDEGVPVLRRLWPEHRVSRFDSAIDWRADFDRLDRLAVAFAKRHAIKQRGWTNSDGGATRYMGSPSSEVMVRLYKKTEELRAKHPDKAAEIPDGIVRAEVQVRPGRPAAKEAAATMAPDDVWGMAKWSALWARETLALDPERTSTAFQRPSDWSRTLFYLGRQYGPQAQQRAGDQGELAAAFEVLSALGMAHAAEVLAFAAGGVVGAEVLANAGAAGKVATA